MWTGIKEKIEQGDIKALARGISLIENEVEGYDTFLASLSTPSVPVIGITGPPGAGKSTLTDALIKEMVDAGKRVGVLCVDPSSPFHYGALLGDRIRMNQWYAHPQVYIRSLASRGSLGGLHPCIIEITELMKSARFDYIIVETVGVGQSEVEIAGLADVTVVVIVPEAGDEIQTMKAGLMEIADIFVVNKGDRPGADMFVKHLRQMLAPAFQKETEIPIIKTSAINQEGVTTLWLAISNYSYAEHDSHTYYLLAERAYHIIQRLRMRDIDKMQLKQLYEKSEERNLYKVLKENKLY
jgi:LAO/AO transport system kinase